MKPLHTAHLLDGSLAVGDSYLEVVSVMWCDDFGDCSLDEYMHKVVARLSQLKLTDISNLYFLPNEFGCKAFLQYLERCNVLKVTTRSLTGRKRQETCEKRSKT